MTPDEQFKVVIYGNHLDKVRKDSEENENKLLDSPAGVHFHE